jgi:hypothetical protein
MIKSSRGKYKTIRLGSICNEVRKYKCPVFKKTHLGSVFKVVTEVHCCAKHFEWPWTQNGYRMRKLQLFAGSDVDV